MRGVLPSFSGSVSILPVIIRTREGRELKLTAKKGTDPVAFQLTATAKGTNVSLTKGEGSLGLRGRR